MRALVAALCLFALATSASAATIERYVNTASSAGGNGTTNATSGANRAYPSCAAWTAAEATNISVTNDIHKVHFEGSSADTSECVLIGWTTSSTAYIWMITDAGVRHQGLWSTSAYRLEPTGDTNSLVLFTGANHVRVEGMQIGGSGTDSDNIIVSVIQSASVDVRISHSIIRSTRSGTGQTGLYVSLDLNGGNVRVWNSVIYGLDGSGSFGVKVYDGSTTIDFWNVTIADSTTGIDLDAGFATPQGRAQNVLFYNNTTDASGTFLAGTDYNAADSGSIGYTVTGGGNSHDRVSQTFTFVNAGSNDYHLQSGDGGAKNFGLTDPSSGLFSDDIDLVSRSGTWDIGADEETGGGGGGTGSTGRILSGFFGR